MVTVSGRLLDFVEDPSNVAQVQVRASEVRPHGDGVMLDHPSNVEWDPPTGTVTFDAAAGTAGVIMWHAVGRSNASGSLPIVVPEGDTATLRECVEAALLADEFTLNALERLALEVTGMVATIQNIAQLEEWAATAKQEATTAQEIATALPATIQSELDTRVPPEVAEALSTDQTIREAATLAVNDAVDSGLPGKADTAYVDAQDTALGTRINGKADAFESTMYLLGNGSNAGKVVNLSSNGQLMIETSGITRPTDAASKEYVDRVRRGSVALTSSSSATYTSLEEVPAGVTAIWSGAANLGVPAGGSGIMTKISYGASTFYAWRYYEGTFADPVVHEWHMWKRDGYGQWRKVAYDSDLDALGSKLDMGGHTSPGLKTVPLALTTGWAQVDARTEATYRLPVIFGAPITRFRIHISNRHPRTQEVRGPVTLNRVRVGSHLGAGEIGTDAIDITRSTSVTQAPDEWVSDWVTGVDLTKSTIIEYDYSGSSVIMTTTGAYLDTNGKFGKQSGAAMWVWLEAETPDSTPVVAMIGDSTGAGAGADFPIWESALHLAGLKHGFLPQGYAHTGDSLGGNTSWDDPSFARWEGMGFARPDSVIIQAGSNDIHGGATLDTLKARYPQVVEVALRLSPVVIGATVKPRYPADPTYDPVRIEFNDWIRTLPHGIRDVVDFSDAVAPGGTLPAEYDADGAHMTTLGHQQMAMALDVVPVARPAAVTRGDLPSATVLDIRTGPGWAATRDGRTVVINFEGWDGTTIDVGTGDWQPHQRVRSLLADGTSTKIARVNADPAGLVVGYQIAPETVYYGSLTYHTL